jgi:hypothetical protein
MKNFDERTKNDLLKNTEPPENIKEEIWSNIEKELFRKGRAASRKKKRKRWIPIGIAVATIIIFFGMQTQTGMAVVDQIKEFFEPEKKVIQEIEGQPEETDVQLNEGTNAEYVIYIDESRYKLIKGEEADLITPKDPLPDRYPEVSLEIRQIPDVVPEELVNEVTNELRKEFPDLSEPEFVTQPVEGYQLHGIIGGQEWDSPVVHAYIISNGKSGSFVITERYFLEAAEGHGARFTEMLKEFKVIEQK